MKFTKAQRHRIYKRALVRIKSGEADYLCSALNWERLDPEYPEIWNQHPTNIKKYSYFQDWGINRKQRISILHKAIQQTKQATK